MFSPRQLKFFFGSDVVQGRMNGATQWDSNSLLQVCSSSQVTITLPEAPTSILVVIY